MSFHWVQGHHQDWNKKEQDLTVKEKLNIAADSYATEWQEDHTGNYYPIEYKFLSSQATSFFINLESSSYR